MLQRFGNKSEILLKKSFFLSKNLYINSYTFPICQRIKLNLPLYELDKSLRCKSLLIFLEFLEQITGLKPFIKDVMLIIGGGLWINCQLDLSAFFFQKFINFLNEFILAHPLLRHSNKLPKIKFVNHNYVKLIIYDLNIFFSTTTNKNLPDSKLFWLEINFFFKKNDLINRNLSTTFYMQSFFNLTFLN